MIFKTLFSYSTNKTVSPSTNSRYIQFLKFFSYLLTVVGEGGGEWREGEVGIGGRRRNRGKERAEMEIAVGVIADFLLLWESAGANI